ncbi:FecR family protein [Hydrogenophaga palleronii]|uniref:FecR family protein n=1 Tax=Hydrogenophaga palleronii TaxID=65655 RepID=UPI00147166D7|nr:FecR domain-containing protein [Hydrogenophaga palleronii]
MSTAPIDDGSRQRQELVGWFLRRQDSHWDAQDEQAFQHWLNQPGHRQAYSAWEADWQLMDHLPPASATRLRAQVAAERARPTVHTPALSRPAPARRRLLAGGLALAGAAAMATTGGWLAWQQHLAQPVYEQAFSTHRGQQIQLQLPDGSTLRLDTATRLTARFFPRRRELLLEEGQAMFAVAADVQRPFVVTAGGVRITVVGTRFAVRLTPGIPGREGPEVAVEEGRVRVSMAAGTPAGTVQAADDILLSGGQRLVFGADGQRPVRVELEPEGVAAWRHMPLSFSDVPLRQALAEMARYGDLGISRIDPAAAELRLSGTIDPRKAAAARRLLAHALPITIEPGRDGLEVHIAH